MTYKDIVNRLQEFPWNTCSPQGLIYLTYVVSRELSVSLRRALAHDPNNKELKKILQAELDVERLEHEEYKEWGSNEEFLYYFCKKFSITEDTVGHAVLSAAQEYLEILSTIKGYDNAMTIFSRVREFSTIYKSILEAHPWDELEFGFFETYLKYHTTSPEVKSPPLDERVLYKFYSAQLKMYESLQ